MIRRDRNYDPFRRADRGKFYVFPNHLKKKKNTTAKPRLFGRTGRNHNTAIRIFVRTENILGLR